MKTLYLPNYGYAVHRFTEQETAPIRNEVNLIKSDFDAYAHRSVTRTLAGNIVKEFSLSEETRAYTEQLLMPYLFEYDREFNYIDKQSISFDKCTIGLNKMWVNFQKKHEFNPPHHHPGFLSFVLYIDIPYDIENEKLYSPGQNPDSDVAGQFQFIYTNVIGTTCVNSFPTDVNFNNAMILFPSSMTHCVQPFYSSDQYRISVAGNFCFQLEK